MVVDLYFILSTFVSITSGLSLSLKQLFVVAQNEEEKI
jgi:hypothetical protein